MTFKLTVEKLKLRSFCAHPQLESSKRVHAKTHTYIHTHLHIHAHASHTHKHTHTHTHTRTHTKAFTHIHTPTHTHAHTYQFLRIPNSDVKVCDLLASSDGSKLTGQCVAVRCSVLQCVAVVLQWYCSMSKWLTC